MEPFDKQWPRGDTAPFPEHNDCFVEKVKQSQVLQNGLSSMEDDFELFLEGKDSFACSKIRRYMYGIGMQDIGGLDETLQSQKAWVASSSPTGAKSRGSFWIRPFLNNPLLTAYISTKGQIMTARQLHNYLVSARQAPSKTRPVINRLFIHNLHQHFALVLAVTISSIYHPHLKVAITKHVNFETSIRVEIPRTFPCFRLDLHLAYFTLQDDASRLASRHLKGPPRRFYDITFLGAIANGGGEVPTSIVQTHLALMVCGTSDRTWNAYCFQDEYKEPSRLDDLAINGLGMDPFADGDKEAAVTTLNPRQFWAVNANILLGKVHNEWQELVCLIEEAIDRRNHEQLVGCNSRKHFTRSQEHKEYISTSQWNLEALKLLNMLIESMETTLKGWASFIHEGGGIRYFTDVRDPQEDSFRTTQVAIEGMLKTMRSLERRKSTLEQAKKACQNTSHELKSLVTARTTESNNCNSERSAFTVDIVFPIMAVMAFYAIPPEHAPFELDRKNFVLHFTVLIAVNIGIVQLLLVTRRWLPEYHWWKEVCSTRASRISAVGTSMSTLWESIGNKDLSNVDLRSLEEGITA